MSRFMSIFNKILKLEKGFVFCYCVKGTARTISRNLPCKGARQCLFYIGTLCPIRNEKDINDFVSLNCLFSFAVSLRKWLAHFLFLRNNGETQRNNKFSRILLHIGHHHLNMKGHLELRLQSL